MTVALATLVAAAIALPHVLRLEAASATAGAFLWFCALILRALTTVAATLFLVLVLPTTEIFTLVTHWCWHTVLPVVAAHLGLDGHRLGDAAVVLPAFVLASSLIWVAFGVARAARRVAAFVRQAQLGPGPAGSVMVGGADVVVAAAGLHRPRVVVSAGALLTLDDEELAASLDHELGHIARRHRYILVAAQFLRALGRPLPGTRSAWRELVYHLERDADSWAVTRHHDPLALASAICKAATGSFGASPGVATALGGGATSRRVRELAAGVPRQRSTDAVRLMTALMATVTLAATVALPAAAAGGDPPALNQPRHCIT